MNTILAYTQHPKLTRAAFLAELQWHQDQDKIVKGTYWQDGRGCAVGCAVNSISRLIGERMVHSDHASLTGMLGIPLKLARLEDTIFEGLPTLEARTWPMRFSSAIQQGADLSGVWPKFAAWMLRENALPAVSDEFPTVRAVIETVIRGMETGWVDMDRAATRAIADAARGAPWAAVWASADAVWASADAVWASADAARAAARAAPYHRMSEHLLVLLAAAPVPEAVA